MAAPFIAAALALTGVWLTMRQKERSERRAEWWRRVTWAIERTTEPNVTVARTAAAVLTSLMDSSLATDSERDLIEAIALADLPDAEDDGSDGGS
ncbi:hypothetical protein HNP11_003264 [Tsukamurella ocularis]|uniref:hypothetical protein n=1 Tax=Tsukamurella ocularis TaxID=1970234 RepID=UPI002168DD28|nr:hypothetical protein [Tsukamurella ocularis]MCS3789072.1 hypothetical protein [Tsukamurella ocularis]